MDIPFRYIIMEDCVPIGKTLFRKLNLYTLDEWNEVPHPETKDLVNLKYFQLFPAPFAGPFALIRNDIHKQPTQKLPIRIYTMTCSSKPLGSFLVCSLYSLVKYFRLLIILI